MMTKSQAAFLLSTEKLFDTYPKIYFWTFTFVKVWPDWYYPAAWNRFSAALQTLFGFQLYGLRVLEVHEGGHGLHYHALLNRRVSVHMIRRLGRKFGIGRVQVKLADRKSGRYLGKYLSKKSELYSGMRRWGTIGGFVAVKKSNIEVDSPFHRNMRIMFRGRKVGMDVASKIFRKSQAFGDLVDWPIDRRKLQYLDSKGIPIPESALRNRNQKLAQTKQSNACVTQ